MIRAAIVIALVAFAWLAAGRRIALLLDRMITIRATTLPAIPIEYDGGGFRIGGESMTFGGTNNYPFDLRLSRDAANRLMLSPGSRAIVLGPCKNPMDPGGRPDIAFTSDPGDHVSFTSTTSAVGWPAVFDIQILSSQWPLWKRYVYYRLLWRKASGQQLEMVWRYEQQFCKRTRWSKPAMMWNSQTGLVVVKISP